MAPPLTPRKVSTLVSFFESPASTPAPAAEPRPTTRALASTSAAPAPVRSGTVKNHVRRFSLPPAEPHEPVQTTNEPSIAELSLRAFAARPAQAKTREQPSKTTRPPTSVAPKAFAPHRTPPLPPSAAGLARTVVVPAHVSSANGGAETSLAVAKKAVEHKRQVNKALGVAPPDDHATKGEVKCTVEPSPSAPVVIQPRRPAASSARETPNLTSTTITERGKSPFVASATLEATAPSTTPADIATTSESANVERLATPPPAPTRPDFPSPRTILATPPFAQRVSYSDSEARSSAQSRPSPPRRSSTHTTHTTHNLPAAVIFSHHAAPLVLPALDAHLRSLAPPSFSRPEDVLAPAELPAWHAWLAGPRPSFFARLRARFGAERGRYVDVEKQRESTRALILPPMHLVPPGLTVTDLKLNRTTARSIVTLSALMSTLTDAIIAAEGSATGISLQTVESFRDIMQMITLIMSGSASTVFQAGWTKSIFVTLPAVVSLDFVSAFGLALVWLWVFTLVALFAVYELWMLTGRWGPSSGSCDVGEGRDALEGEAPCKVGFRNSRGYKMAITFLATSLYLPLSKLAIGALAWTSDFWALAENPYLTSDSPTFSAATGAMFAGDDFCWRTTMRRRDGLKNLNWAWAVLPVAIGTVLFLTLFLPWRLYHVVKAEAPKVDKFTELGDLRKDETGEYMRLLDEDKSAFSFMYRDYRRPWAHFKAIYMLVKLVNILLICLLTKNNCIFRSRTSSSLGIIRESSLLAFMSLFLLADTISKPFLGYIANNSDRVSRIGFVAIALIGLLVVLNVDGENALGGGVLIFTEVVTYLFNGYFALIGTDLASRIVHRLEHRLDFSIDLFSPRLDRGKHVSRRVWQETLSTILLASPEFRMPAGAKLRFTDDAGFAPQLLGFSGTQAERHIEDLKILRTIGLVEYHHAIVPAADALVRVRREIQLRFTGPDIYYRPLHVPSSAAVRSHLGRLDVQAFPFVCTFRSDEPPSSPIVLSTLPELLLLVEQNASNEALARRRFRLALRALEGQVVFAPYAETRLVGVRDGLKVESRIHYRLGLVQIERNSDVEWRGYRFASGFRLTLAYADGQGQDSTGAVRHDERIVLSGEALGIPSDFSLSPAVANLLRRNRAIIEARLPHVASLVDAHREYFRAVDDWKARTLSHAFMFDVATNSALEVDALELAVQREASPAVRALASTHAGALTCLEERKRAVGRSTVHEWWFLLWDDLWRRNQGSISLLQSQPDSFSPFYRTSVAYVPMARAELQVFLSERGLGVADGKEGYFNSGFLNRIYFYLDEIMYSGTDDAIDIHLGNSARHVPFADLDLAAPTRKRPQGYERVSPTEPASWLSSRTNGTRGTGDGTSYDDWSTRDRLAFPFEEMYDRPAPLFVEGHRWDWVKDVVVHRIGGSAKTWLGLRPFHHDNRPTAGQGVTFDLRNGKEGWELPRRRGWLDDEKT